MSDLENTSRPDRLPDAPGPAPAAPADLEDLINSIGDQLHSTFADLLEDQPEAQQGPQALARSLGVDKVLASRLLKALRTSDPMAVVHRIPGPDPLRRLLKASAKHGADPRLITGASNAVDRFETLIREEMGDRSSLDAIISAWVPEARREFELRRKQAAFKAMSQLKGAEANTIIATVFLHPSEDERMLDVVWLSGLHGLHRLRPDAGVKFATRRLTPQDSSREPRTLDGESVDDLERMQLPEFCTNPLPQLNVHKVGEVVHYTMADTGFGPKSAVDLVFCEVNLAEMRRYIDPGANRKGYVFAEVSSPARRLQFDVLVHEDVYPDSEPTLRLYDTALEGVADVNNPARDIDILPMMESVEKIGNGISCCRSATVARYSDIVRTVCQKMDWNGRKFRVYRCQIDYPIYGAQVAMLFNPPTDPNPAG